MVKQFMGEGINGRLISPAEDPNTYKFIYNYYSVQSVKALEMQSNLNPLFSTGYNLSLFQPKLDGNYTVCPHNLRPRWCHKLLHFMTSLIKQESLSGRDLIPISLVHMRKIFSFFSQ